MKKETEVICELCGEPILPKDMFTYARPDGFDNSTAEPAHKICVESLEEVMYRQPEFSND